MKSDKELEQNTEESSFEMEQTSNSEYKTQDDKYLEQISNSEYKTLDDEKLEQTSNSKCRTQDDEELEQIRYRLDESCKKLLSNKEIIAWILKTCAEEYKDCDVKEIMQYIEGNPLVALVPVHQDEDIWQALGEQNAPDIKGSDTEDKSLQEGTVRYDVKFHAISPLTQSRTYINLIINIECQNHFHVGYPIVKRGIYYCGRMLSAQYRTVFTGSEYDKLQKVYSIWICTAPPKYLQNSINLYSLAETKLVGNVTELKENYDMMTIAMIYLGNEEDPACTGVLRLLSTLFSDTNSQQRKREILNEFKVDVTKKIENEVSEMCEYSSYIEERAIERGRSEGRSQGRLEGHTAGFLDAYFGLIDDNLLTIDKAAERANMKLEDFEKAYNIHLQLAGKK